MKKFIFLAYVLILSQRASGQVVFGNKAKEKEVMSGFLLTASLQAGGGGINPKEVNRYIEKYMLDNGFEGAVVWANILNPLKHYSISDYNLTSQTSLNFSLVLQPAKKVKVRLLYEYAKSPKKKTSLSVGDLDSDFDLHRHSLGIMGQYYFPIKDYHHLFAGAGIIKHNMTFELFKANATGYRFELGYSAMLYFMEADFFLFADFVSRPVSGSYGTDGPASIDFSGVSFGMRITPWFGRF